MGSVADTIVSVGTLGMVDTDFAGDEARRDARRASQQGAALSASSQQEALNYLKEKEALPMQYRDQALQQLSGLAEAPPIDQQQLIDEARNSPLYQSIMGGRDAGEEAIARTASATGGLRSGNVQDAFYKYNTELENTALLESYNQAYGQQRSERDERTQILKGLSGLQSYAPQIAQGTANVGATLAQGQIAGAQADIAARNAGMDQLMGLGQLGVSGAGVLASAGMFSDIRLKENIKLISSQNGVNLYSWDWNDEAANLDLFGSSVGFMAHEIYEFRPELIGHKDGYITITLPEVA